MFKQKEIQMFRGRKGGILTEEELKKGNNWEPQRKEDYGEPNELESLTSRREESFTMALGRK